MSDTVKSAAWSRPSSAASRCTVPAAWAGFAVAIGSTVIVTAALFFEHVLLIQPCPLCLEQRKFHYAAIPLALVLLSGAAIAVYHSGVEWKLWAGPADCSGPVASFGKAGGLLEQMQTTSVVRCDEASWRFLGLSLAGYNAIISLVLAAMAAFGAWAESARR